MDYKFWILLLLCIVLFYMYHQIEDLKSEVQHLHTKTTNIAELENYIEKVKATEITKNLNNAINEILPNNKTTDVKLKSRSRRSRRSKRSRLSSSKKSSKTLSENISSSVLSSETSIGNENIVENYSNKSETSLSMESNKNEDFNIELDDVMNIIEQNHINDLNENLNNKFKISEIVENNSDKTNSDVFIESNQESPEMLENKLQLNNEDDQSELNNENKIELNEENEENEEQIIQDINEDKNAKYNELMNKNVEELRTLASEQNITITKSVGGKQKKKRKKELCEELAYMK